jgi:hypothetical protein
MADDSVAVRNLRIAGSQQLAGVCSAKKSNLLQHRSQHCSAIVCGCASWLRLALCHRIKHASLMQQHDDAHIASLRFFACQP